MIIGGIQKTTLIDYPGKIAAIVFTAGCNFNCGYCHNSELRNPKVKIPVEDFFAFLENRKGKLDAVVITGGEPTMHQDLLEFAKRIKSMGFLVKLDTNGSNPEMLETLIENSAVDYIAMDIKAPIEKYFDVANCAINKNEIKRSIKLVMAKAPDYEFRTTVVAGQLDERDFEEIGNLIGGAKRYFIQKFVPSKKLADKSFEKRLPPDDETIQKFKSKISKIIKEIKVR